MEDQVTRGELFLEQPFYCYPLLTIAKYNNTHDKGSILIDL